MAIQFLNNVNADSGVLYVDAVNNKVGIGTTSPSYTLDVNGVIRGEQYLRLADTGGTNRFSIRAESTYGTIDNGSNTLNYNANNHLFLVGLSEKMRINSSGKVGIGTTNPTRALQVIGTDGAAKFYYHSSFTNAQYTVVDIGMMTSGTAADGFGPKINFRMGENGYDGYVSGSIGTVRNGADGTHNMTFGTSTSGSTSTKMTITNAGDVGIGTTSPSEKLEVAGKIKMSENSSYPVTIKNSSSSTNAIETNGGLDIVVGSNFGINFKDGSTTNLAINGFNGNVGVATTSPSQKFHVNGTALIESTLYIDDTSTSIYRFFNELIIQNTASTSISIGGGPGSVTNNLEVNGAVTATATTDAYKGYIKQTVVSIANEKSSTTDYNLIPYNTLTTTTSNQYYNRMVAAYDGRVKKVYIRNTGGSTPDADVVNFKKQVNNVTSSIVYSGTVSNAASAGMSAYYDFASSDFTFSAGDTFGILYQTTNSSSGARTMGGVAVTIILEYNIT